MKHVFQLSLSDEDLLEFLRVLIDEDPDGALAFLKAHLKGKARQLLEGG
jgi:hypothetical protein